MTAASADTVTGAGIVAGTPRHRGGVQSAGEITYAVSIQVNKDSTGAIAGVRGAGRITKVSKARVVQVDTVVLGTSRRGSCRQQHCSELGNRAVGSQHHDVARRRSRLLH